ncbi:MAG: helix-turn-helix domain-containing protein [Bifidobacteriaceae bacterium]|nr:helix-turn-helix domain-containing protein [Bifidobacteriaceae bacterium]
MDQAPPPDECGAFKIDDARSLAWYDGQALSLRPKELAVLSELVRATGGFRTTEELLDEVWPADPPPIGAVVKAVVHSLRRKTSADAIISAKGLGYRIASPGDCLDHSQCGSRDSAPRSGRP